MFNVYAHRFLRFSNRISKQTKLADSSKQDKKESMWQMHTCPGFRHTLPLQLALRWGPVVRDVQHRIKTSLRD